jgi:putative molybdopterin biosynthesis protein
VAIISTGDEIVSPGEPLRPGAVYDSNLAILSAAVTELGGEPVPLGVVNDEESALTRILEVALQYDVVLLSGGTSKGAGDLSYRVVSQMVKDPGIVAHGVALKPGKPICLAVTNGKPVAILPGFPTSAIFTFHEFVAPVIRRLAGRTETQRETRRARLPMKINSDKGRTEYTLVSLMQSEQGLTAYPMGKGSGSVTTFSNADGFITIGQQTEILEAGTEVYVHLLGRTLEPADLVIIGSHCIGVDLLLGLMHQQGFSTKSLFVGSLGGLSAAKRGECDLAGVHLLDPQTGEYNVPFLTEDLNLIPGYTRMQHLVFRPDDRRFAGVDSLEEFFRIALADETCTMVNRNAGSGTRILIDQHLGSHRPAGYALQPKSHNAVAAAIQQGRADWGVAIETVARNYGLSSIPLKAEHYDFVSPKSRADRPAVIEFLHLFKSPQVHEQLYALGFEISQDRQA